MPVYTTLVGYSGERPTNEPSEELKAEYNGLKWPCKSETVTAHYTKYEFFDKVKLEIELPEDVGFVNIKPEAAAEKVKLIKKI